MRKRNTAILFTAIVAASSFGASSLLAQEENQQKLSLIHISEPTRLLRSRMPSSA